MNIKIILLYAIYDSTRSFFMWMPSLILRRAYLRLFFKKAGKGNYFARNIDIRAPFNIVIGSNNIINKHAVIDGRGGLVIGNNIDIAQDAMVWTEQHNKDDDYHKTVDKMVRIEDYVWIASRATILPGVTIAKGAVVATGAIVTKDVAEMMVVAGVPAKPISKRKSKLLYQLRFHPLFRF